ncbi:Mitotic spindle-associated MMXD complex subunit MIP18, partial [Perkinsus olseni]
IRVSKGIDGITKIDVEFTPTIPTCSVATLIGLTIRTKLQKCVCGANGDIKINVNIKEGTHDQEEQVNKQLNDKERCQAAIENPNLQKVIRQGIFESDPPLPDDLQLIPSLSKRDLTAWQEKNLLNEVEIFLSVDHPNICRLAYVFEAPTMVHLVMELCRGPDLHEMIYQRFNSGGYFSEPEVADIIAQVLYAINYLHTSNIVHRDIKPSHFMFTCGCPVITDPRHVYDCPDRRLKLFDFGLARRIGSSKSLGGGTLSYMAPECLEIEWESRKPLQRRVSVFGEDELDDQQDNIDAEQRGSGLVARLLGGLQLL